MHRIKIWFGTFFWPSDLISFWQFIWTPCIYRYTIHSAYLPTTNIIFCLLPLHWEPCISKRCVFIITLHMIWLVCGWIILNTSHKIQHSISASEMTRWRLPRRMASSCPTTTITTVTAHCVISWSCISVNSKQQQRGIRDNFPPDSTYLTIDEYMDAGEWLWLWSQSKVLHRC